MKAIRLHARGGPEQIVYEDAPMPALEAGDALVRVGAAGVTPTELTWGTTYRTCGGAPRLPAIPGHDVSGTVAALAPGAEGLAVGQAVYGLTAFCRDGTAAEYVAVRAADLAPRPRVLDDVQAAAVPLSALTAWQALFDHAGLAAGQRVLIHGAAGGVGTFAVQLAAWRGAHVIGTASARNHAFLNNLAIGRWVDYTAGPFEAQVGQVDAVLDTVGGEVLDRSWAVVRPGGVLVTVAGSAAPERAAERGVRGVDFIVEPSRSQLQQITELIDAGRLRPILAEALPLAEARAAFERGLLGHTRGKMVLRVA